jgi:photosystem II stability/assembly factor-like uncharacterized protein
MMNAIKFALLIGFALYVTPLHAAWEPIGPSGGNLRAMARSRTDESRIYGASFTNPAQIVKSTDGGDSWTRVGNIADLIYCLIVDPVNPEIVYAGGRAKIFKSSNGGTSWNSYPVSNYNLYNIAIHPTQPAVISAVGAVQVGAYYYLSYFRSTNAGVNWVSRQIVTNRKSCAYCLAIDPADPQTIYVGGSVMDSLKSPLIFRTLDAGTNFTDISAGFAPCSTAWALAVHPIQTGNIYCATDTGIYRSTDYGATWNVTGLYRHVYSLATSTAQPGLVVAGADTTVYKSTDAGLTWFKTGPGCRGREFRTMAVSQTAPANAAAGNNVGFFKTSNGGSTWDESNHNMNINAIDNFTVSRSNPSVLYAEIGDVGEFKTTDSGASWVLLPDFLSCGSICGIAAHNSDPDTVFALEGKG